MSTDTLQGRLVKWALALQEYMITIEYNTRQSHRNADALSRCFMQHQAGFSQSEEDAETMILEDQLRLYGAGRVSRDDGPAIAIPETADALQAAIEKVLNAICMKIPNPDL